MRVPLIVCTFTAAVAVLLLTTPPVQATEKLQIGGTGASLQYTRVMARNYTERTPGASVAVHEGLGSSGGIRAVLAGALDLAISGRPLNAGEAGQGVVATELLRTPFGFFTSRRQPVRVEPEEIAHLYEHPGCNCNWFGGEAISIILRSHSDSDTALAVEYFEGLADSLAAARLRDGVPVVYNDQENAELAEELKNSLTTGTLLQMVSEQRDLRPLVIGEVEPTIETLQSGEYPFTKTLYLVHRDSPGSSVRRFTDYLRTDDAAEITRRFGAIVIR